MIRRISKELGKPPCRLIGLGIELIKEPMKLRVIGLVSIAACVVLSIGENANGQPARQVLSFRARSSLPSLPRVTAPLPRAASPAPPATAPLPRAVVPLPHANTAAPAAVAPLPLGTTTPPSEVAILPDAASELPPATAPLPMAVEQLPAATAPLPAATVRLPRAIGPSSFHHRKNRQRSFSQPIGGK